MAKIFKVTSYKQKVLNELQQKVALALKSIGKTAVGHAQDECPVDTGRLRNSITFKVKDNAVYVGTNVEYAKQVEYNDHVNHKVGKAHYLRDAVTNHKKEYKALAEAALKE